mgnify:FL=1
MTREDVHGFGAPKALGSHVFQVHIPGGARSAVTITEDFGFLGGQRGVPETEPRAEVVRTTWTAIRDVARKDFNARLRHRRLPPSSWKVGDNPLDHLLGKELCVLAWASEDADREAALRAAHAWSALRPEERWWLFGATVTHGGRPSDRFAGWRTALRAALQEDTTKHTRTPRPDESVVEAGRLFR